MKGLTILALMLSPAVLIVPPVQAQSAPAETPTFGPEYYVDSLHGFALRPPPETSRVRETSSHRLVAWISRDEKTAAIRRTLEVFLTVHEPTTMPAAEYATRLADELGKSGLFNVEGKWVGSAAGRPTMNFRGLWGGRVKLWRVQTWVQMSPRENLVLSISGPQNEKHQLEKILRETVATLKLFDPVAARKARMKGLLAGAAALTDLNDQKLRKLLSREPAYFLIGAGGKTVGFLKISETPATRDKFQGVLIVRIGALKPNDESPRLMREEMFATSDRVVERWKRVILEGQPPKKSVQEGEKIGEAMRVRTVAEDQKPWQDKRDFPVAIRNAYLPSAFDVLTPRLIQRTPGATYGFAVYNSSTNEFELRTITVAGPEPTTIDGREVKAVRLTDQASIDSPTVNVWVDDKGLVLKIAGGDGLTLERTDSKTVTSAFSAEMLALEKLGS